MLYPIVRAKLEASARGAALNILIIFNDGRCGVEVRCVSRAVKRISESRVSWWPDLVTDV